MGDNTTIAAWRAAGESGDAEAAGRCLAPEIELISPLTAAFRFRGPAQVTEVQVMAGIGPRLLRRQGQPGLARVVTLATGPLNAMAHTGERRIMPLADPNK